MPYKKVFFYLKIVNDFKHGNCNTFMLGMLDTYFRWSVPHSEYIFLSYLCVIYPSNLYY